MLLVCYFYKSLNALPYRSRQQMNDQDRSIINQIRSADEHKRQAAMKALYADPTLRRYTHRVMQDYGIQEREFEDLFEESMTDFIMNILQGKFRGDSQLSTYFYSICDRQCKNLLKKTNPPPTVPLEGRPHEPPTHDNGEKRIVKGEKRRELRQMLDKVLNGLSEKCRRALLLWKQGISPSNIAEELGYRDANSAKARTNYCRKKLREFIATHAEIRNKLKALR